MTRFRFGENWSDFASRLTPEQIAQAERSLRTLLGKDTLRGLSFLDIGCGSGLFSLAASNLGAAVTSFDADADSVATAHRLRDVERHPNWTIREGSILDLALVDALGRFDIVYSWGVLHHTGAMWDALGNAAALVKPGGLLAISLYRKTGLCGAWQTEKRIYATSPAAIQAIIRAAFKMLLIANLLKNRINPIAYIRNYDRGNRGMAWHNDIHDWLGGYPYESAHAEDVKARLDALGFAMVRSTETPPGSGWLGNGCDEFVAERRDAR